MKPMTALTALAALIPALLPLPATAGWTNDPIYGMSPCASCREHNSTL